MSWSSLNLFYKVHSATSVTESLEKSRELSLTRVFLVEFSPGAASSTQNCAHASQAQKSPLDVEPSQARAYPRPDIVSRNGRVSQYSRNAKRRFPLSEFAGSEIISTREKRTAISRLLAALYDNVCDTIRYTPNRYKRISTIRRLGGNVRRIYFRKYFTAENFSLYRQALHLILYLRSFSIR